MGDFADDLNGGNGFFDEDEENMYSDPNFED